MNYSKQLLSRYISSDRDLSTLTSTLTLKVCEVEQTHVRTLPELVVLGKVVSAKKHPDADKLTICDVDCGSRGHYQICTGAENIRTDIYVPVALPGCFLPAINLQIDPRTMRGVESNGMICSKQELGIGEDLDLHGIWIMQDARGKKSGNRLEDGDFEDLDDNALGKSIDELFPWLANRVIEIENKTITHRPDLFGHFGLAREYQALFSEHITFSRLPQMEHYFDANQLLYTLSQAQKSTITADVQSPAVGAYHLIELANITVKESSLALRLQLIDLGIGPRNNRVDFSNYFMYLAGQPIHCFDADQIDGHIIVRQANDGEQFVDLFDTTHTLSSDDIVITDATKILALAGVVGGKTSGITEKTTHILIELAQFDPVMIRKTALRIGTRTEAATRFEKSISPLATTSAVLMCMDELKYLQKDLGDRSLVGIDTRLSPATSEQKSRILPYDISYTQRLLGTQIPETQIAHILKNLGFGVKSDTVVVPLRRGTDDMLGAADLVEEVARIYGYDRIDSTIYTTPMRAIDWSDTVWLLRRIEQIISDEAHYTQMETYPWIHQRRHEEFSASSATCLEMENALSPEQLLLRHTMVPSMLELIEKNAPFYETIRLFDIGKVWHLTPKKQESDVLCMIQIQPITDVRNQGGFLTMKGTIEQLITQITGQIPSYAAATHTRAHSIQQAQIILEGITVGSIARLHPRLQSLIGVGDDYEIVTVELNLSALLPHLQRLPATTDYQTLQDQLVSRDLSFVIPKETAYGVITDALRTIPEIATVQLIDLYTGPQLGAEQKSISLRLEIRGDGKMSAEQIQTIVDQAIAAGVGAGGTLRGGSNA